MKPTRNRSIAAVADRFGRNPNEHDKKSASKIGSSTILAAAWATLSRTVGIPNGRTPPRGFGISTRLAGAGRYPTRLEITAQLTQHAVHAVLLHRGQGDTIHPSRTPVARTRSHASHKTSPLWTRSYRAWKRRPEDCFGRSP